MSEGMKPLTEDDLRQFTGSENFYRHPLTGYLYTEGVQFVAERAGAYWLIDAIASITKHNPNLCQPGSFLVWKLEKSGDQATLTCEDGDGHILWSELIPFTNFPLQKISIWFETDTLLLPSEH